MQFNTSDGDYFQDPPVGFWPEYLSAVVDVLNDHYRPRGTDPKIKIERKYYDTSDATLAGLEKGEVYLTEPYYVVGAFYKEQPRIESTRLACTSMGYESSFVVSDASGVSTTTELYDYIMNKAPNKKIVTLSTGDFYAAESLLPPNTGNFVVSNYEDVVKAVRNGEAAGGLISGRTSGEGIHSFKSGIISPRGSMFVKQNPCEPKAASTATIAFSALFLCLLLLL